MKRFSSGMWWWLIKSVSHCMSLLGLCLQLHCWVFIDRVHATISLAALAEATWTVLKSPCYYITRKLKNLFFLLLYSSRSYSRMLRKSNLLRELVAARGFVVCIAELPSVLPVSLRRLLWFTYVPGGYLLGMYDKWKIWMNSASWSSPQNSVLLLMLQTFRSSSLSSSDM